MKKQWYEVSLTRTSLRTATVHVEATCPEEAIMDAVDQAGDVAFGPEYESDVEATGVSLVVNDEDHHGTD